VLASVSSSFQSMYQMRTHKIHRFKPKVEIFKEIGPYVLKTASTIEELKSALKLRYEVFHHEMIGKKNPTGIDVDEFDLYCDHLIIINKKTNRLVGTYRLNSSLYSKSFYSAREFDLKNILSHSGNKLELGRACIQKEFRNGITISLLWGGIAEYMIATDSQIVFGCASIKTENPREAALIYRYLESEGSISKTFDSPPTEEFTLPQLKLWLRLIKSPVTEVEQKEVKDLLPSLFQTYRKIGAVVAGEPAWDEEFHCIDFLTVMKREDLSRVLWRKYRFND